MIPKDAEASNIYVVSHLKESPLVALLSYARKFLRKDRSRRQIAILPALQFCKMVVASGMKRPCQEKKPSGYQQDDKALEYSVRLIPACNYADACQPILLTLHLLDTQKFSITFLNTKNSQLIFNFDTNHDIKDIKNPFSFKKIFLFYRLGDEISLA